MKYRVRVYHYILYVYTRTLVRRDARLTFSIYSDIHDQIFTQIRFIDIYYTYTLIYNIGFDQTVAEYNINIIYDTEYV